MAGSTHVGEAGLGQATFWVLAREPFRRNALVAAALGWMLDSMDVMLYSMVMPAAQAGAAYERRATAGLMMSADADCGGGGRDLVFGFVADRMGRTRALIAAAS